MNRTRRIIAACLLLALGIGPTAPARSDDQWTAKADLHRAMLSAWRESISAPSDDEKKDLAEASRKLRDLMLPAGRHPTTAPKPESLGPPVPKTQPAANPTAEPTTRPAAGATTRPAEAATQPTTRPAPKDAELFRDMPVEKLRGAVGTADTLYAEGQYEVALTIYQRIRAHDSNSTQAARTAASGQDWLVYQAANCNARLGRDAEARKLYGQLLREHVSSPWASVAKVQGSLAAWRLKEKPGELVSVALTEAAADRPKPAPIPAAVEKRTTAPK